MTSEAGCERAGAARETAADKLIRYAEMMEEALASYIPDCAFPESKVAEAMAYSLLGGGKRIRGALVLAFYRLWREDVRPALPFACAMEMVHAYSLIHDDLPCMDDDDLRRGKPSCHVAYGEAIALLAGDALLTLAFEAMAGAGRADALSGEGVLRAIKCLANAAGVGGMIGGQAIDLEQEGKPTPPALLSRMYSAKTGMLIGAAAMVGCVLASAGEEEQSAAIDFAGCIGMAYQIVDDILDVTGDEALLGKPVGSDDDNKKSTFVGLFGLESAAREVMLLHGEAKKALGRLPGDTGFLAGLADILADRKA